MLLGDNVVLVKGSKRVALYDMGRNTLIRAPHFVSALVDSRDAGNGSMGAAERKIVDGLVTKGYLQWERESGWRPFSTDATLPSISPLANVIVDADERSLECLSSVLESDAQSHLIRHIIFVLRKGSKEPRLARVAMRHGLSFELAKDRDGGLPSDIYSRSGKHVGTRTLIATVNARSFLQIEYSTMILLQRYVESAGTVYVDAEGAVYPHFSEKHFLLGDLITGSLTNILASESYRRHIGNRKDIRQRCGTCELRLACLRSFVDRVDPQNIASAPSSCQYDPSSDSYQNALFT